MLKKLFSMVAVGLVLFLVGFYTGRAKPTTVYAQSGAASGIIPKAWGTYKGDTAYGLMFEDSNGTLRIVKIYDFVQGRGAKPELEGTLTRQ